jgi:hypothetical protein
MMTTTDAIRPDESSTMSIGRLAMDEDERQGSVPHVVRGSIPDVAGHEMAAQILDLSCIGLSVCAAERNRKVVLRLRPAN